MHPPFSIINYQFSVFAGLLALAVIVALPLRRQFADFHEFVHRTPKWQRAFLALLAAVFIAYGSTKTNQVGGIVLGSSPSRTTECSNLLCTTTTPRIAPAAQLASLGGYSDYDYLPQPSAGRLPEGAILATNWWRRGCWEDCRKVEFADGWVFPFGTNHFSSVVVMSQGGVRTGFCDASEIAALGTKVALVPFDSCFCHEHTPSNSYRFAWDRAYVNRDTNTPMTASIELFRTGDVCVTTNGVPTVGPYVIPFPHVGVGQNDDWVRTNFLNAAEILSAGYADWVDAQVGVDLDNGLYKFTATFPVDPPEATELFVGDLSVCVTNAGEYVFLLEKGVEYSFGTNPFDATVDYSMQDDLIPPVPLFASWWGGDNNGEWTVDGGWTELDWPSQCSDGRCLWMPTFCGSPDVGHLWPGDFPMTFTAQLSDFCRDDAVAYHWSASGDVWISSPDARETDVVIETLPSWGLFSMSVTAELFGRELYSTVSTTVGTNSTPDPAGVSVSFSKEAIIFEDAYCDSAGQEVPRRSSSSVLHCSATGGEHGGRVEFDVLGGLDHLVRVSGRDLPWAATLGPGEQISFDVVFEGRTPSEGHEDVVVQGVIDVFGASHERRVSNARLTVMEAKTHVRCNWIPYEQRKDIGVGEELWVALFPEEEGDRAEVRGCEHRGIVWTYKNTNRAKNVSLEVCYRDAEFVIPIVVLEPLSIQAEWFSAESTAGVGAAGGIIGWYNLVMQPTNVSFDAIRTAELPSVATNAIGYFAQEKYGYLLDHGQHGAGKWHGLNPGNRFQDKIGVSELPPPWLGGGSFTWPIQNAWILIDAPAVTNVLDHLQEYDQRIVIDHVGTTKIEKFGYSTQRDTNGVITVTRSAQ